MLDQLIALVKQNGGEAVVQNPAVPNEQNEQVMAEASSTVASGLQNILAGGGLQNILNLFSGAGDNNQNNSNNSASSLLQNPIVTMMVGHLMKKLMSKFNMSSNNASNVASSLIPNVLNGLISKTQDPNDNSIDLNSIIRSLTGGNVQTANTGEGGFDFRNLLDQFTQGGNGGGGFNIQDIISQVTQGAQQHQEQEVKQNSGGGSGGLMDMIKGFFN